MGCINCDYEGYIDKNCPQCGIDIYSKKYEKIAEAKDLIKRNSEFIERQFKIWKKKQKGMGFSGDEVSRVEFKNWISEQIDLMW